MDRKDLKIQALLEKVSSLTTEKENQIADLRVDLTITTQERDQLRDKLQALEAAGDEVVDAEVVSDSSGEN